MFLHSIVNYFNTMVIRYTTENGDHIVNACKGCDRMLCEYTLCVAMLYREQVFVIDQCSKREKHSRKSQNALHALQRYIHTSVKLLLPLSQPAFPFPLYTESF
jgi:predicted Fe-S protein YdhL (DUF1289 family)